MSIAPNLRDFVDEWLSVDGDDLSKPNRYRAVMGELRALLAGANAIYRHVRWLDVQYKREGVKFETVTDERLRRAYSRLARLSSPRGARRTKRSGR